MNSDTHYQLRCTYRLQLKQGFGFPEAAEIADYLDALGISHVYCSPYLQAAPGSTHGYDVLDHQNVNAELGGTLGHETFSATLGKNHLGQVLDIVPNHMSIAHSANRWWWDVLENGPSSQYADYFDVDWEASEAKLHNLVSLPILGGHYGDLLESGEISIHRDGGSFEVHYADRAFPLAPRSLDVILSAAADKVGSDLIAFAADVAGDLPLANLADYTNASRRHRDKEILRRILERDFRDSPEGAEAVDAVLADINASPDKLDELLSRQNFRLAHWRTAKQDLGYRRFFDVNSLVGLRMENARVFRDTHALIFHWVRNGVLDGLRIDHPDGLRDPQQYFKRLATAAPNAWIVAEKILTPEESLPENWPVAGTTGYDFLNRVLGIFIDPEGEAPLTEFYAEFTGESTDYPALAHEKKHLVMRDLFASDMNRLTAQLADICESHRRYRDYTRRDVNSMLREVVACLPVYRTYIQAETGEVSDTDRKIVTESIEAAKEQRPDLEASLFDFFKSILLLETRGELESELVMRFQQSTGPVMAKGMEDTLFYCFNRFVALNEVGSEPSRFGLAPEEFHRSNQKMLAHEPHTMLATATHDTKRGEDMRARLAVLSEMPQRWAGIVREWSAANEKHRTQFQPDRNTEYFYYQTLVGAWPVSVERMQQYMEKAMREAKQRTSWLAPDEDFEKALRRFIETTLNDADFLKKIEEVVAEIIEPGRITSLSQTLIKLTSPGVPDIYQGCELWDLSLVDPDNRRPVDYELRRQLLNELEGLSPEQILKRGDDALPKLWVVRQTLSLRRKHHEWFDAAAYRPLSATGKKAKHVIAFARGENAITVAPRLVLGLAGDWADTAIILPDGPWRDVLTGDSVRGGKTKLADLLKRFPVALLAKETT
jgi:(1->4)-alpha-D-glucan 1-alpha-D-glucosylmutase